MTLPVDFSRCRTLNEALDQVVGAQPERPALVDHDRTFTFAEFGRAVSSLAALLGTLGSSGDRCAVLMDNSVEHLATWFAVMRAGFALVPINASLAAPEVAHQIADSGSTVVAVTPEMVPILALAEAESPLGTVVVVEHWTGRSTDDVRLSAETRVVVTPLPASTSEVAPRDIGPDETAVIWYTTGTTGHPKGAVHTHGSCVAAIAAWIGEFDWTPEDRGLVRNMYHVGMMATVVAPLLAGASLAFAPPFTIESYIAMASRLKVTVLRTFPVMLALMERRAASLAQFDLSAVRRVGVGGSGIPDELLQRSFERFPKALWDYSWSQSELNSGGTNVSGDAWLARVASCGRPIGCVSDLAILDASGQAVAQGSVGEVCVRSATEMTGYLHNPGATAFATRGGWLHTDDLGYLDPEGYLYLVARSREVIIRGGENIYPAEIERVLSADPAVEECVAVGIPDSVMGEVPVAFVVLREGSSTSASALHLVTEERLARYKRPVRIEVIEQIPKNSIGKTQRLELERLGAAFSR